MKKLIYFILCSCSFSNSLSVEQLYGDRIELLGIPFKDPLVLCQILIALFLVIVFFQSSMDKIFDRENNLAFFESHFSKTFLKYFIPYPHISFAIGILFFFSTSGLLNRFLNFYNKYHYHTKN